MEKEDIKAKLIAVLGRLGKDIQEWPNKISGFGYKLELLFYTNRYNKLLKALFSSNELNEFNSHVFEVLFAYDFESKGHTLNYEINQQMSKIDTSPDFCYKLDNQTKIYFELHFLNQREWITALQESSLKNRNRFEIFLNGKDEIKETIRLQNIILRKCQADNGKPIKFHDAKARNT